MEYLLKASGIIALFYTIYVLCLRNVTFFKANRFFLLSGLLFALVFPLITIPIYIEYAPVDNAYTSIDVSNIFIENSIAENTAPLEHADTAYSFKDYALLFYVIGVIVFLVRFIIQLVSLASIIAKNKRVQHDKYTYVTVTKDTPPFSFFNWIVYNPNHFSTLELEQILTHEKAHANQIHSIDILIAQFVSILLWFNPFMYLYTKSLKQNLEFLADNTALHFLKSKKDYQYILLKTSAKNHQLAFGNNFYNSFIKKRIIMLQTSKSKNINFIKYLLILPVLGWFLMSFNSKTIYIEKEEASSTYNDPVLQFEIKSSFTDKDFIAFKKDLADLGFNFEIKSIERKQNNLVSAIDFVISKNNTEGRYRIARGMPIAPVVIQYFENKNKFIINTENFNSTLKELEKSQNTVQIVIDKNSSIEAIETKKKFLKDN